MFVDTTQSDAGLINRSKSGIGGFAVGIMHVEGPHAIVPGSPLNAGTFDFPVLYDAVTGCSPESVMSGDPRQVPEAKIIDEMSYSEAMELAYFGAKVIHPQTMAPAVGRGIPLWIRNTFNASHPGTKISASSGSKAAAVKGISGVDRVALVNLEGAGMIGVPG